jgi:hypothetical protein
MKSLITVGILRPCNPPPPGKVHLSFPPLIPTSHSHLSSPPLIPTLGEAITRRPMEGGSTTYRVDFFPSSRSSLALGKPLRGKRERRGRLELLATRKATCDNNLTLAHSSSRKPRLLNTLILRCSFLLLSFAKLGIGPVTAALPPCHFSFFVPSKLTTTLDLPLKHS